MKKKYIPLIVIAAVIAAAALILAVGGRIIFGRLSGVSGLFPDSGETSVEYGSSEGSSDADKTDEAEYSGSSEEASDDDKTDEAEYPGSSGREISESEAEKEALLELFIQERSRRRANGLDAEYIMGIKSELLDSPELLSYDELLNAYMEYVDSLEFVPVITENPVYSVSSGTLEICFYNSSPVYSEKLELMSLDPVGEICLMENIQPGTYIKSITVDTVLKDGDILCALVSRIDEKSGETVSSGVVQLCVCAGE